VDRLARGLRVAALLAVLMIGVPPMVGRTASAQGAPDTTRTPDTAAAVGPAGVPAGVINYVLEVEAPDELREPLQNRTLLGRWREDPEFSDEQMPLFLARGREEAIAIAQAGGWFAASARVTLEPPASPAEPPRVRIVVDPGTRAVVRGVAITLRGAAAGGAIETRLAERWPLPEGSVLRTADWELGKRLLLELLQAEGYLRARLVESHARIDAELGLGALSLVLDSGPRIAFGALELRGLQRYPRRIVDDLRPFERGEPYSLELLLIYQQRLRLAGQFASATVLPDLAALEADPALAEVPLIVDLAERTRQRVSTGLGYSTDQGVRALLGYDHRNLMGRGWQLESGVVLEQVRGRAFATVRTPQAADGSFWQAGLRSERLDTLGEFTRTHTVYAGQGLRRENTESFVSLQYQTEYAQLDQTGGERTTDHRDALTLGWAWSRRELDSRVDPRRGWSFSSQVSGSVRGIGSAPTFGRLYARTMRFWPVAGDGWLPRGVLIGLAESGWVITGARLDIPSQNLFRAGGAQSVRGYRYLSLGLREGEAIVGGRMLALGSLEYQFPVQGAWWGASFVDAGNVVDTPAQWRPAVGYGVGVRWRSPIGPVNLDLAWADRDRRLRAHFSVGYSF
jgi:translocation and assembly module TamA